MTKTTNRVRALAFADAHLDARLIENVRDFPVDGIVVNLSPNPIHAGDEVSTPLRPWRSTILYGQRIRRADRIAVLRIIDKENLGGVMLRGWQWFGDVYSGFPRRTPLFVSPVDDIGTVIEDAHRFVGDRTAPEEPQVFALKLKCWWSPNETDCFIHNEHPFLEVHTQIMGRGRMQKFRRNSADTLYEDVLMTPGFTHEAFCVVSGPNRWTYPWHRYYTDTESVWLAVELHPEAA